MIQSYRQRKELRESTDRGEAGKNADPTNRCRCHCGQEHYRVKGATGTCEWSIDNDPDFTVWETTCGEMFVFEVDGPRENKMKFCCYCGKPLEVKEPKDEAEEKVEG